MYEDSREDEAIRPLVDQSQSIINPKSSLNPEMEA